MGSVANKIAKKLASLYMSRFVDMECYREGMKMALEAGAGDDTPVLDGFPP